MARPSLGRSVNKECAVDSPPDSAVLIVDDEPLVSEVLSSILHSLGYTALVAANGIEALEQFKANKDALCCVILDYSLPGLHPTRALAQFREIKPAIKVLLSSGYSEVEILNTMLSNEIDLFLPKPFNVKELSLLLARTLATNVREA